MDRELRDRGVDQAYRDLAPDVYRVAFGILRDADDARDATHEAFARAWERWEQYDSNRPLLPWLHGIVAHQALDQLRRRRVRRLAAPVIAQHPSPGLPQPGGDPAADVIQRSDVEHALDTLKPEWRATLILRHYYGYDYASIAGLLGTTSGTVGSNLSRAHAALRLRLGDTAEAARRGRVPARSNEVSGDRVAEPPEVIP